MLFGSSKTRTPFFPNTRSSAAGESMAILYSKPEHPPSTTLTRSPCPDLVPTRSRIVSAAPAVMVMFVGIVLGTPYLVDELLVDRPIFHQPSLVHDLVLDAQKPLRKSFRTGRTAGDVNVYRNDLID